MSSTQRTRWLWFGLGGLFVILGVLAWQWARPPAAGIFDGERAYADVTAQMAFGPRLVNSPAHRAAGEYMETQLRAAGWETSWQEFTYRDTPIRNLLAKTNVGRGPIILLGAHYDSRFRADQDPERPNDPVPGANDGASGVAVLLELARTLDRAQMPYEIWLAFFDAEDNGDLDGWEWLVGSTYMANHLSTKPQQMILVDMIGDADQQIYYEGNSNPDLRAAIWAQAATLGYSDYFTPTVKYTMLDDHIPFQLQGIPAVDLIDFDYPHWHRTTDTADKVSAASLERVGRTLETYLEQLSK